MIETESERLIRQGVHEGINQGIRQGREDERYQTVKGMLQRGKTPKEISDFCEYNLSYVKQVEESMMEKI